MFNFFEKQSRILYIVRGISGSGKSSLARQFVPDDCIAEADRMPGRYGPDGKCVVSLHKEANEWCQQQAEALMQKGKRRIAVANTFSKRKYYQPYLDLAQKYGYTVQIVHCEGLILPDGSSPGNIHQVPDYAIVRQQENWEPFDEMLGKVQ